MPSQNYAKHTKRVRLEKQNHHWYYLQSKLGDTLGVEFGKQLSPADLGTFGHLLVSVDSLKDALNHLQRFYPLVGEGGDLKIDRLSDIVVINYQPHYKVARQVRVEAVLASIVSISRQITFEAFELQSLYLDYQPEPEVLEILEGFCRCKILTRQKTNAITMARSTLKLPLHHANPAVAQSIIPVLTADLDALSQLLPLEKVRRLLLRQPYLNRQQVAERMHMSERSLGRALKAQGTDFVEEKKTMLLKSASKALQEGQTVAQVAEILHYSDASAFIKAYKSWTGRTPGKLSQPQP